MTSILESDPRGSYVYLCDTCIPGWEAWQGGTQALAVCTYCREANATGPAVYPRHWDERQEGYWKLWLPPSLAVLEVFYCEGQWSAVRVRARVSTPLIDDDPEAVAVLCAALGIHLVDPAGHRVAIDVAVIE
jgi:hypothetical protein